MKKLLVPCYISVPVTLLISKQYNLPQHPLSVSDNTHALQGARSSWAERTCSHTSLENIPLIKGNYGSSWTSQSPVTQRLWGGGVGGSFSLPSIQFMLILHSWGKSTSDSSPSTCGLRTCVQLNNWQKLQWCQAGSSVYRVFCVNDSCRIPAVNFKEEWLDANVRKLRLTPSYGTEQGQRTRSIKGSALTFAFVCWRCFQRVSQTRFLYNRHLCPPVLETGGPGSKYLWIQCLEKTCFLVHEWLSSLCPYIETAGELPGFSLIRMLISFMRTSPSWLNHLSKAHLKYSRTGGSQLF